MNQKGLLVVQTDDDRLLTFSPSGWYWLEEARSLGAVAMSAEADPHTPERGF
jgi:hypothetical protein